MAVLALLLIGGVFFVWQKMTSQNVTQNPVEIVKNEDTIDTSDWKTYRNEVYGYSIQHPNEWYVDARFSDQDFSQRGPKEDSDFMGGDTLISNYPDAYGFNLGNRPLDIKEISLVVFKIHPSTSYDQFKYGHVEGDEKKSYIEVNGDTAYRIERTNIDHPVGVKVVTTFIKRDGHMFLLTYSYNPKFDLSKDDGLNIYEKVVDSIRFIR